MQLLFFDFVKHPEEIPAPMVYQPFTGIIIRLVYGLTLLGVCFWPVIQILRNIQNFKLKQHAIQIAILGLTTTIAVFIPIYIIGERIHAIVAIAGLLNLTLLLVALFFYGIVNGLVRIRDEKTVLDDT